MKCQILTQNHYHILDVRIPNLDDMEDQQVNQRVTVTGVQMCPPTLLTLNNLSHLLNWGFYFPQGQLTN